MSKGICLGALDQGTTGSRFIVFDTQGRILRQAYKRHRQVYPNPGWVEHDPKELLSNVRFVMRACLKGSEWKLAAIGVTNQRETVLAWDRKTGKALYNAIVWQDTRTAGACQKLKRDGTAKAIEEATGLPLSPYFSATKMAWLFQHVPAVQEALAQGRLSLGTVDSWLLWHLTGGFFTEPTNASRTLLMNLESREWDPSMLEIFGIPLEALPKVRPSLGTFGEVSLKPFGASGSIPIACVLGDQQAALFGQRCFKPREVKNTFGTGNFILVNVGQTPVRSQNGLIPTVAWTLDSGQASYALEGSIAITGALLGWIKDNLGIVKNIREIESLAESVPDSGGIYFVPAFSGLYAPYWDASARGTIMGISGHTTKAHIARAALEATAFQCRDVLEAMAKDLGQYPQRLKADGGGTQSPLLMQTCADISFTELALAHTFEITCLGAALGAGLASGIWEDFNTIKALLFEETLVRPASSTKRANGHYAGWLDAVARSRGLASAS